MIAQDRRTFLQGGSFVIGALAANSRAATAEGAKPDAVANSHMAGFGWEAPGLCDNGADFFLEVRQSMILQSLDVDVSAAPQVAGDTGFAEVLCMAGAGANPRLVPGDQAFVTGAQPHPSFGTPQPINPNNLQLVNSAVIEGVLFAVILKTWVPAGGGGATARHVTSTPGVRINAGEFIVFHMDHCGVPVDAEMQVALKYQLV